MPEIKPFQGIRYDKKRAGNAAALVSPPYDIISKKDQNALYRKNLFNVVRLELGKDEPGDTAEHNKYTRAASCLEEWLSKGILMRENRPSLYIYVQDYKDESGSHTRVGFLAAMRIDEKAVLKHENTLAAPKEDRLSLLKATRTNLSPIFGLFEDASGSIQKNLKQAMRQKPAVDVTVEGVRHRLYVDSDPKRSLTVARLMRNKPLYIADGHHRFEVATRYKNLTAASNGTAAAQYVLTYFADWRHNPFTIYPTHRLVRFPRKGFDLLAELGKRGHLEKMKNLRSVLSRLSKTRQASHDHHYRFGLCAGPNAFYLFTLSSRLAAQVGKSPVERLDVSVLHRYLVDPRFGIRKIEKSERIDFTRDADDAARRVRTGQFDAAFFLRPTSLKEVIDVSKKGLRMPQKSTYFYPKLLTGLVFRELK